LSANSSGIRLLACDMDGTLFRGDLIISAKVQAAIAAAQQAGVLVVLATGRMPAAARTFVRLLNLGGPQIFSNGALVASVDGEVVFHLSVDSPTARHVVNYCAERRLHVNAYIGDDVYVASIGPEAEFTRRLNRLNPIAVPDLGEFVSTSAPTKMVVVRLPEVESGLLPQLQQDFVGELLIFSSVPQYCEMVNPNVDKGRALANLIGRLGIPREAVAAIGDGDNDVTLLEAAGLPIAMGNATTELKSVAREIVGSVEEDGVAEAIDRFVIA
jgi:Cof subfamily protein (haloacid dehalogenase superfamily)